MYGISLTLNNYEALHAAMQDAPEIVLEEITAAVYESELYLQRDLQELDGPTPEGATGFLRKSMFAETPQRLGDTILGTVGSPLRYAEAVELGTKPHWAPLQPLIDWVEQKEALKLKVPAGQSEHVAKLIQFKIAAKGTKGAFMFKTALADGQAELKRIFDRAQGRILRRLSAA